VEELVKRRRWVVKWIKRLKGGVDGALGKC
jgi:hypothetical protein